MAMRDYKQHRRSNPVMRMVAERLSDAEIGALAHYYESLSKNEGGNDGD